MSCDYTAREDPRGLDYGYTNLSVKANIIGYICEIVEKGILLWPDFSPPKVPSYLGKINALYIHLVSGLEGQITRF